MAEPRGPQIKGFTPVYAAQLDPLPNYLGYQAVDQDEATGDFYMTQAAPRSLPHAEHTIINRFNADYRFVSSQKCFNAGHGSTLGLWPEKDAMRVMIPWEDVAPRTGFRMVSNVASVKYGAGTFRKTHPAVDVVDVFTTKFSNVSITGKWMCVRSVDRYSQEIFTRRLVADVLAGKDVEYGVIGPLPEVGEVDQGHTLCGDDLYRVTGATDKTIKVYQYQWSTGKLVTSADLTKKVGFQPGEKPVGRLYREPESMFVSRRGVAGKRGLFLGVKMYGAKRKRFRMFQIGSLPVSLRTVAAAFSNKVFGDVDVMEVQRVCGVEQDGWVGPATKAAFKKATGDVSPSKTNLAQLGFTVNS